MTGRASVDLSGNLILTVNGGSSSLKFALFSAESPAVWLLDGKIERIGLPQATSTTQGPAEEPETRSVRASDQRATIDSLLSWLADESEEQKLVAVGHRVVHGRDRYVEPCVITSEVCAELRGLSPLDPTHLPFELALIDAVAHERPGLFQVACFDTAFHWTLPRVAQMLPLPRRLFDAGVRRYGFHGLSYTFLLDELERTAGSEVSQGRLILAHLGNGASLAAVAGGRSLDTTMAFTTASGVPMGTRSGDLDPGVVAFLARSEGMNAERFDELVQRESGLLGVSGISSDIRELLERAHVDHRASEAIDLFCYEIKKRIGAFAAALGGLDSLVFTGGVGENSAPIRERICGGLEILGIRIDPSRNSACAAVISPAAAPVTVRVIRTDEERVIAEAVVRLLKTRSRSEQPT
jgi:acetate kinase